MSDLYTPIADQAWDKLAGKKCPQIEHRDTRWFMEATNIETIGELCQLTRDEFNQLYQAAEIARAQARVSEAQTRVDQTSDYHSRREARLGLASASTYLAKTQRGQFSTQGRDAAGRDIANLQTWFSQYTAG